MNMHSPVTLSALMLSTVLAACSSLSPSPAARSSATQGQDVMQPIAVPQIALPPARSDAPASTKGKPMQFADAVPVSVRPESNGLWSAWDEYNDRWRVDLVSRGARSLNLHFDRFLLPQGAILRLYAPAEPQRGIQLTAADNKPHGAYWSPEIAGDTLRLDLILPRDYDRKIELSIANVNVAW